uniref:Retrovirus-related Pol polyprotein from transposon TNT 1-94 n=1 Tax=Cajanus cajan TaxID=3821 RepID=A0A151R4A8_CAJCA|nr:Retrovirus-related Pol polyprotein from transposon TNT 1-94 [Cajanus cajan]
MAFLVHSSNKSAAADSNKTYKKERPKCAHCGIMGHTKDKCYKLVGYPPNYFSKNKQVHVANQVLDNPESSDQNKSDILTPAQCQQLINFLTNQIQLNNPAEAVPTNVSGICMNTSLLMHHSHYRWVIDSGATSHICCHRNMYHSYTSLSDSYVMLPNSTKVKIVGIGSIHLNHDIHLHNVLFIPSFRFNLLSLLKLINENQFQFTMQSNSFVLQDLTTMRRIGTAKQDQGLLFFDFPMSNFSLNTTDYCNLVSYDIWHKRLGHIPINVYNLIASKTVLSSADPHFHCSTCQLSKQNRLPFPNPNHFSPNLFDLLHADIWGPFREHTYDGFKYFLTLVEDKSRFTWIFLLKHKSDCVVVIPQFISYIETQFNKTIKTFRSDNAKELAFNDLFSKKGIIHQYSCVERPQQNSVVERKHLHILNIARALMFQSNVPLKFWVSDFTFYSPIV